MKPIRFATIAGIMILFLNLGCSPEKRYTVLSFFFDGVPDPGQQRGEPGDNFEKPGRHRAKLPEHGPYAAKMCDACHLQGGGQLKIPVEKLCVNCHELNLQTRKQHGPVVSGGCRVCHDPHGSGRRFNLVAEPTTFCFYCHDPNEVGSRDVHKAASGAQCTECHNPHGSDNDYLLK